MRRGTRKLRITGGEPLVRRDVMSLFRSARAPPCERRPRRADADHQRLRSSPATPPSSRACGVRRVNVSLDTLDEDKFRRITRWGDLPRSWAGSTPRKAAGLAVKINAVALKGVNEDEIPRLLEWAHGRGCDLTLIEVMPLGEIEPARVDQFLPLSVVRARLLDRYTLDDLPDRTGGPARYVRVRETGGRLGFITPLTHNFCESCNRVRLTCTGQLFMCLGQEDAADLRAAVRRSENDGPLMRAIEEAIGRKPKGHDFVIDRRRGSPAVARHMSVTGG